MPFFSVLVTVMKYQNNCLLKVIVLYSLWAKFSKVLTGLTVVCALKIQKVVYVSHTGLFGKTVV